ncbi:hypothetical protein BCR35DRAFT_303635 [Leucosporidium creatinivorum]|uniref:F-box domain-containing protein n=1 Tax=Leucosporidium creatinivorum TaxID=106004 RepID=A0A1Y2FI96_9BASI|nr:hypothetical protein BCR35DRAFT_303635 [Leucosporidium creatinivorum]
MIPPLPTELIQNILEHAVESCSRDKDQEVDVAAADASIRQLLLAASLVSTDWRPFAQDLLLRRVALTNKNHEEVLIRIEERGVGFAKSIRFLRLIGERLLQVWEVGTEEGEEEVFLATRILNEAMAVIPCVETVELVRVVAHSRTWLTSSTSLRNLHLIDSSLIQDPNEPEMLHLDRLVLASLASLRDRSEITRSMTMALIMLGTCIEFRALRFGYLGEDFQSVVESFGNRCSALKTITKLELEPLDASSIISSAMPSPLDHPELAANAQRPFRHLTRLSPPRSPLPTTSIPPYPHNHSQLHHPHQNPPPRPRRTSNFRPQCHSSYHHTPQHH